MLQIIVGSRCRLRLPGADFTDRRGTVKFVGRTNFQPGFWVGIQLDEPTGKNDGSVRGERYFTCPPSYGLFARPDHIECGDFPEIDLEAELAALSDDEM